MAFFLKLPVKSLLRFKCVAKSRCDCDLYNDQKFVLKHYLSFNENNKNNNCIHMLFRGITQSGHELDDTISCFSYFHATDTSFASLINVKEVYGCIGPCQLPWYIFAMLNFSYLRGTTIYDHKYELATLRVTPGFGFNATSND